LLDLSETTWNEAGDLFWRERNSQQGSIFKAAANGSQISCISEEINVGGGLFYGGGSFGVSKNWVVFVDGNSQQLIRSAPPDGSTSILTSGLISSASPNISPDGQRVLFVHSDGEHDAMYLLDLGGDEDPQPLIHGADFYNYPRWHPHGDQIAWISWDYPHMPWDSSTLWLGSVEISHQNLKSKSLIAGGEGVSVIQPEFSPDGKWLAYISDQSGWWQIHIYNLATGEEGQLTNDPADHALPPWLQNRNAYGFTPDSNQIYFLRNQEGLGSLWKLDLEGGGDSRINLDKPYTWLDWFAISPREEILALIASASDQPPQLITIDPSGATSLIRKSSQEDLPKKLFSIPKPISWSGSDNSPVKGLFYPPHNPEYESDGKPPLLVMIHSGPTSQKFREFSSRTQFFTSRGFAVLEVNYRGSTGYGRSYRQALQGQWGVIDVDDCLSGAYYVTDQGWAERDKMALMGSSSGGLTVYQILVKYPGVFQAGIALYGIVNHLDLLKDPPKFERYYSEWLIGPYPEQEEKYRERSPVFFADQIQDPIAVFQGGKDPIVPRDQADQIIQKLRRNQVPHLYVLYLEEKHGFKTAENIADFYQQSLDFLNLHLFKE
jgi:dipeptidyl aminopeptidase/acylaminoacyl peptidase